MASIKLLASKDSVFNESERYKTELSINEETEEFSISISGTGDVSTVHKAVMQLDLYLNSLRKESQA